MFNFIKKLFGRKNMIEIIATIAGTDFPIRVDSFRASETLNNRPTASFTIVNYTGSRPASEGQEVVVKRVSDNLILFSGRVGAVRVGYEGGDTDVRIERIECVGYEAIADKRLAVEIYNNRTAGYIVNDLISKYLAGDGIAAGTIADGAVIPSARFGYRQVSEVLRTLAEANGFVWFIDWNKNLHFVERDVSPAPWAVEQGVTDCVRDINVQRNLNQYRNRQYILFSEITGEQAESFAGDGLTRTWNVAYPIAEVPEISVNNVPKSVGINGLDSGKDFYWNKGSTGIHVDETKGAPASDGFLRHTPEASNPGRYPRMVGSSVRGEKIVGYDPVDFKVNLMVATDNFAGLRASYDLSDVANISNISFATFISDRHILVQYETEILVPYTLTYYWIILEIQMDSLVKVGSTMNMGGGGGTVPPVSGWGDYFVYKKSSPNEIRLYHFNESTLSITYKSALPLDYASYNNSYVYRDYIVISNGLQIVTYRIDRSNEELVHIATFLRTGSVTYGGLTGIGGYVYVGRVNGSAGPRSIDTYLINDSTDTVSFVRTINRATNAASEHVASINDCIVVTGASLSAPLRADYYRVDPATGVLEFLGTYIDTRIPNPESLVSTQVIGSSFIFMGTLSSAGRNFLRQSAAQISIKYKGTYPNVLQEDDLTEQADRQNVEGGTGLYASVQQSQETIGDANASELAQQILKRYGKVPETVRFRTRTEGLKTGQLLSVNWPALDISGQQYLIERINVSTEGGAVIWYDIQAISGENVGNWQEFWRSLRETDSYDFGGGDTLPVSRSVRDVIAEAWTDSAVTDVAAAQTQWDLAAFDIDEWQ